MKTARYNKPSYIKYLAERGFTNKQICIITRSLQPYVTKVMNGTLCKRAEATDAEASDVEKLRERNLEMIKACTHKVAAPNASEEQIAQYIQLLRFLGVPREKIRILYGEMSTRHFDILYKMWFADYTAVKPEWLGISQKELDDLLFFAEE